MVWIEPLNLEYLLINTFAGSITIFIMIALIFISGMAIYFRMPLIIVGSLFSAFAVMFSYYLGGLWLFTLAVVGVIVFYTLAKIWK